ENADRPVAAGDGHPRAADCQPVERRFAGRQLAQRVLPTRAGRSLFVPGQQALVSGDPGSAIRPDLKRLDAPADATALPGERAAQVGPGNLGAVSPPADEAVSGAVERDLCPLVAGIEVVQGRPR